ncbi:ParB/RepB/Spo0J family partition protein [Iodobacter sp. CM08]|uniref:ParB/RepB/Spo0J family partition protein n=1 Tax=Iodobacter sp. CM08 TaxID=3085902 RepID=UPI002980C9F2|nr:ParB/RepB/Spo0J family partition protein [Iodobacter sp. CM08]MDW5418633.1 ParB/RepB/Spo0J family partition protein [Iodobacter sp. CM08]
MSEEGKKAVKTAPSKRINFNNAFNEEAAQIVRERTVKTLVNAETSGMVTSNMKNSSLLIVNCSDLHPGRYQPRNHANTLRSIKKLADQIQADNNQLLQPPKVKPRPEGGYEIIAGERRWRAWSSLGNLEIPVIVTNMPDEAVAIASLVENIQREDLTTGEIAMAIANISHEMKLTDRELSSRIGFSGPSISKYKTLSSLMQQSKVIEESIICGSSYLSLNDCSTALMLLQTISENALLAVESTLSKATNSLSNTLCDEDAPTFESLNLLSLLKQDWTETITSAQNTNLNDSNSTASQEPQFPPRVRMGRGREKILSHGSTWSILERNAGHAVKLSRHLTEEKLSRLEDFIKNLCDEP